MISSPFYFLPRLTTWRRRAQSRPLGKAPHGGCDGKLLRACHAEGQQVAEAGMASPALLLLRRKLSFTITMERAIASFGQPFSVTTGEGRVMRAVFDHCWQVSVKWRQAGFGSARVSLRLDEIDSDARFQGTPRQSTCRSSDVSVSRGAGAASASAFSTTTIEPVWSAAFLSVMI